MKKSSTIFLQVALVLIGLVTLAVMVRFPMTEGRAANLDLLSIYMDPFIIFAYVGSIPFYVALYQACKLLGYIGRGSVFSASSVKALRTIKYCAMAVGAAIVCIAGYIRVFHAAGDDPAGFIALCIMATFVSVVVATAAAVFERTLQAAVDLKSENDLTV